MSQGARAIIPVPATSSLPVVASVSRHSESSFQQSIQEFVKGRQCIRDVPPSAPALNPPSARDRMSAPSRTASSTNVFDRVCIVCATPSKFCTHYASTYSKAGTPTSATSCVYRSSLVNQMERFIARLCIPTEFRRIPAEFRHKAPARSVPARNRHRNVI
jgi:hypothetical protein